MAECPEFSEQHSEINLEFEQQAREIRELEQALAGT
jgi:hypothetical protein